MLILLYGSLGNDDNAITFIPKIFMDEDYEHVKRV